MKCPSFESLIVTFIAFLALSPCMIYFMTAAADDNGSSGSIIIRNLFYLGMNLTIVSAILWAILKKFMEEPPYSYVPRFYRKRKQSQQRQHSSASSNQGHSAKGGDAKSCDSSTSKCRYFRKNKRFHKGRRMKVSKWVCRKRPFGKRLFVGYLSIIMSLITTATAVPVMVEGLENTDGYSDNLQCITCLELLSFLFIPFLSMAVYRYYRVNQQRHHSSSVFQQRNSASANNANTNENAVASGSDDPSQQITRVSHKMRLPCLDTVFIYCMAIVIFSPCSLSLAIAVDMNHGRIKNYYALGFFLTSVSAISWVVGRSCSKLEYYHNKLLLLKANEEAAAAAAAALTQALKRDDDPTIDTSEVEDELKRDDDTTSGTTCSGPTNSVEQKAKHRTFDELVKAQKNALIHPLKDTSWYGEDDTPHLWTRLDLAFPHKVHSVSFRCSFMYEKYPWYKGDDDPKCFLHVAESPEGEEDGDGMKKDIIFSSPCAEDDWKDLKFDFQVRPGKKYSLWYQMGGAGWYNLYVRNASVQTHDKMKHQGFEDLENARPIRSSYSEKTDKDGNPTKTVFLGEEVPLKHTANGASYREIDVELRGITFRQLRLVYLNALRRCVDETWLDWKGNRVTPDSMTLYDIVKYVVKPFTKATGRSFVESLPSTAGTQPPRFFMSHWWGEPFPLTMDCLEQFIQDFSDNYDDASDARGGGMTEDTPIWICAFANNQWGLNKDMADDPKESSFAKAMGIACFRTVAVLDDKGVMLTRLWCNYEQYLVHILAKKKGIDGLMTFYTAHRYKDEWGNECAAVGIIPGQPCYNFPFNLVFDSLPKIDIRSAEVSVEADGKMIRNAVAGNDILTAEPPADHANYDSLNDLVKASLVSSNAVLVAAHKAGGEVWESTLKILSKGTMTGEFELTFSSFSPRLTSMEARELVCHVPLTCTGLFINNAYGDDCEGAIDGLLEWLEKKEANSLTSLNCYECKVGDDEKGRAAVSRLAAALASNHAKSMEELYIQLTDLIDSGNVSDWASALEAMPNLKELKFYGSGLSEDEQNIIRNATHAEKVGISL